MADIFIKDTVALYGQSRELQKAFPNCKTHSGAGSLLRAMASEKPPQAVVIVAEQDSHEVLEQLFKSDRALKIFVVSKDIQELARLAARYPSIVAGPLEQSFVGFIQEAILLNDSAADSALFSRLVGKDPDFKATLLQAEKAARSDATVLLLGESGTGKELFARGIHDASSRAKKPFVAVNCAAIPQELLELEFFGSIKGAFTDAVRTREGYFAAANGGTLFLDEVGEIPQSLQAKILRAVQEKTITPVGATESFGVDVRIISATHRNLQQAVDEGKFRRDLFYRLQVVTLEIPPLRERLSDVPLLVTEILTRLARKYNRKKAEISAECVAELSSFDWPGNVRQLENVLEQAFVMTEGAIISEQSLPDYFKSGDDSLKKFSLPEGLSIKKAQKAIEDFLISQALKQTGGNKTHAAKLLDVSHRWLLYTLKKDE